MLMQTDIVMCFRDRIAILHDFRINKEKRIQNSETRAIGETKGFFILMNIPNPLISHTN